jgi:hypothetical protein
MGIMRPTTSGASLVVINPDVSYKLGLPENATVVLGTASGNDTRCTHGFRPSEYPKHVYKCYVASAIVAGRFPVRDYPEICKCIDQLVDNQSLQSDKDPPAGLQDITMSRVRDSLEMARLRTCSRCQQRRDSRRTKLKKAGFLMKLWMKLQLRVGTRQRRVCETCQDYRR